jgi:uncharacterized membrane protein
MINIKTILLVTVLFFTIDMLWIIYAVSGSWRKNVENVQKSPMVINKVYGTISYLLIILGILYFVQSNITKENYVRTSIIDGFLYGLILYGVFDFTNLAIFSSFELKTAIIDMIWGGVVTSTVLLSTNYLVYSGLV